MFLFLFCNCIPVGFCSSFLSFFFKTSCACCLLFSFPFFSFVPVLSCLLVCPVPVGRGSRGTTLPPPPQQMEGCLVLQNSMAFWEWDNASPPPIKPPKKSASASCLVCGGAACVVDSLSQTPPPPPHTFHSYTGFPPVLRVKLFY